LSSEGKFDPNVLQFVTKVVGVGFVAVFEAFEHDRAVAHVAVEDVGFVVLAYGAAAADQPGFDVVRLFGLVDQVQALGRGFALVFDIAHGWNRMVANQVAAGVRAALLTASSSDVGNVAQRIPRKKVDTLE